MFNLGKTKRSSPRTENPRTEASRSKKGSMTWDIPVFFGIIFALSLAELCFTIDSFIYLQRQNKWWPHERQRMAFLIFSCVRTILLSAVYLGFHCCLKYLHSSLHTIFLLLSTIFWIISGVLMHQMWGYVECANQGVVKDFGDFKSRVSGGLSECHEIKIIEILAWTIAGVSVLATIPVVFLRLRKRKQQSQHQHKTATSG